MGFTVAQIQQQNQVAAQALANKKISQADYQKFMSFQNQALTQAQANEAQQLTVAPSNYWTQKPSPSKPATIGVPTSGIMINPPTGQTVVNVKPIDNETIGYELIQKQAPLKQSDLSIGEQALIAFDVGSKLLNAYTKDNPIANAEVKMALNPLGFAGVGALGVLEKRTYELASLPGSAAKSIKENRLVYAPGFEGFNEQWKTPKFAPTSVDAAIGQVLGDSSEAKSIQAIGGGGSNAFYYQMGSVLGEASFLTVTSLAENAAINKTTKFVKTVINPKIDFFAENTLSKSKMLVESGLNKIEPGLGKATSLVAKSKAVEIGTKLDLVETKISSKFIQNIVNPIKYGKVTNSMLSGLVSTKKEVVTFGERGLDLAMPQGSAEASLFMRNVVKPNLSNYSKVLKPTVKLYSDDIVKATQPAITNLKAFTSPLKQMGQKAIFTAKEPWIYSKSIAFPQAKAKILTSTKAIVSLTDNAILQAKQPLMYVKNVQVPTQIGKATQILKPATTALTSQKTQLLTELKVSTKILTKSGTAQTAKAIGIVAAGTARYSLGLAAPKQTIKRTPLKFDVPTVKVHQQTTQIINILAQPKQSTKKSIQTVGMPSIVQPYPKTATRSREDEETLYLTMPGEKLRLDKESLIVTNSVKELSRVSQFSKVGLREVSKRKTVSVQSQRGRLSENFAAISGIKSSNMQGLRERTLQTQKLGLKLFTESRSKQALPSLTKGLMGGGGSGRGGGLKTGRWYFKRHPIPSATQQLKQLGFGGSKRKSSGKRKRKSGRKKR